MVHNQKLPTFPYVETQQTILNRMKGKVSDEWDKSEGGFIHDALAPAATEFEQAYLRAKDVLAWSFAVTSYGEYLDMRASERGITRRQATKAVGTLEVTGKAGSFIPANTVFSTEVDSSSVADPTAFVTLDNTTIPVGGTVNVVIAAVTPGVTGNVPAGAVKVLVSKVDDLETVTNPAPTTGGTDTETDQALLARYLDQVRNPGASGNVADYVRWAREADPLVGRVRVLPLALGNGTVKVVITDVNDQPVTESLINQVQTYIDPNPGMGEGVAPIGCQVIVSTPVAIPITIRVTMTVIPGYDVPYIKAQVETAIRDYLNGLTLNTTDNDVRFSKIGSVIGATDGVQDYEDLALSRDGGETWHIGNIAITDEEMATLSRMIWL